MSNHALPLPALLGPAARPGEMLGPWVEARQGVRLGRFAIYCCAHVGLGLMLHDNPDLATAHGFTTVGLALTGVVTGAGAGWTACAAGYIAGADVLWRMTQADTLHQSGKYAIALILLLWMGRNRRLILTPGPLLYFGLLLPSVALVVDAGGIRGDLRRPLSFNLSGPLALAMSVLFFRQARLTRMEILRVMGAVAVPVCAVATIAAHSTFTAKSIRFGGSNFITSGGYGPNQVSSILGMGFLMLLLLGLLLRTRGLSALFLFGSALLMGTQCALTFSRGGLYSAGAALLAAIPFLLVTPEARRRVVLGVVALVGVVLIAVLPWLQEFTQGAFLKRIQDTRTSGRDQLMARDVALWSSNAMLGVGPGMSKVTLVEGKGGLAHTEFTRMIAEHGAFGALSGLALLLVVLESVRRAPAGVPRALAACFSAWALVYMLHAAMRLVAPSFLIGLGAALTAVGREGESEANGVAMLPSSASGSGPFQGSLAPI